jgi:hypothetical protein
MHRLLFLVLLIPTELFAQFFPKEGSQLNYRLIGFSFLPVQDATKYTVEIAQGNFNSEDSFQRNAVKTLNSKNNKIIGEVPAFGKQYTWRVISTGTNSTFQKSELRHFSTLTIPEVDTAIYRFRITKKAEQYKDSYVFLDGTMVLCNMQGQPVWFLPNLEKFMKMPPTKEYEHTNLEIRDLKLSPQGTITFLAGETDNGVPYEINYNGDILWEGPNNGKVSREICEYYHNEFTRLFNGHYMVLGTEYANVLNIPPVHANNSSAKSPAPIFGFNYATIIEYNENKEVVWFWKSSSYFKGSDLSNRNPDNLRKYGTHANAFFFDEKNNNVYISFRDISRIVKIGYPQGNFLNAYGEIFKKDMPETGNKLFCGQHACKLSKNGYLYLHNNGCDITLPSKITLLEEPVSSKGNLKKIWEYQCTVEGKKDLNQVKSGFTFGGNVIELADNAFFVSMSCDYSKIFIVNKEKKILWSGLPEKKNVENNTWQILPQYRASIINSQDVEKLIQRNY